MKSKRYIVVLFASIAALCTTSCEDFLESTNPNNLAAEDYWNTLDDTETSLTSVYATLYDEDLLSIIPGAVLSDMGFPREDRIDIDESSRLRLYTHSYTYAENELNDKWSITYQGIFRANQVIAALENLPESYHDSEDYISQMCQVRYLRGLFYHFLHTTYNRGSIPIHKEVPTQISDYYRPCEHPDSVLKFYRDDLLYAFNNWPTTNEAGTEYLDLGDGYVSRYAVATTLGISYMYSATEGIEGPIVGDDIDTEGDLATAIYYLKDIVIDSGEYSLAPADELFTSYLGEFTSESILEINYVDGVKTEETSSSSQKTTNYLCRTGEVTYFTLPTWIVYEYEREELDPNDEDNYIQRFDCDGNISEDEVFTRSLNNVSQRTSQMITSTRDHYQPYYLHPSTLEKCPISETKGLGYYRKYTHWDIATTEDLANSDDDKSGKNVTINRLSEVYLLYAEAMIYQNNIAEALYYMNKIRARWGLKLLGTPAQAQSELLNKKESSFDGKEYNKASLLKQLQDIDKPLELSTEGHFIRFIDLRRWGIMAERFKYLWELGYGKNSYFSTDYITKIVYSAEEREIAIAQGDEYSPTAKPSSFEQAQSFLISDIDLVDGGNAPFTEWLERICEINGRSATYDGDGSNRGLNQDYYFMEGYDSGKSTFNEDSDAYWPIPSDEKSYNPNIDEYKYVPQY